MMSYVEVLRRIAPKLEKSDIPYMITGSIAASYYGLARATQDLDIVISSSPEKLRTLIELFPQTEYYAMLEDALDAYRHQSMFNVLDMVSGWKIDFIFQKSGPFSRTAFERCKPVNFGGVASSMISVEDLILSKLEWSKMSESERQVRDAAIVMEKRSRELDRDYLSRWVKELRLEAQWDSARRLAALE